MTTKPKDSVRTYFESQQYNWIGNQGDRYGIPASNIIQILVNRAMETGDLFDLPGASELKRFHEFLEKHKKGAALRTLLEEFYAEDMQA